MTVSRFLRSKVEDLYLVRHGESPQNKFLQHIRERTIEGEELRNMFKGMGHSRWLGLTEHGVEQARAAGRWLRNEFGKAAPNCLLTASPTRARETAGYIHMEMGLGDAVWKEEVCFDERNWGAFDHLGHPGFFNGDYERLRSYYRDHAVDLGPSDGESLRDLYIRAYQRLQYLIVTKGIFGKTVLVSHYDTIGCLGVWLKGGRVEDLWEVDKLRDATVIPQNGAIFHYSRRDPASGKLSDKLRWVRKICPWNHTCDMEWTEIPTASRRHCLTLADLIKK